MTFILMGAAPSYNRQDENITDDDIKNNISRMFRNSKPQDLSEATYTLNDMFKNSTELPLNTPNQPIQATGGYNPNKNRHLKYEINNYINNLQNGGANNTN